MRYNMKQYDLQQCAEKDIAVMGCVVSGKRVYFAR